MPVIPALRRWRWEDGKFILGYILSLRLAWSI